MSARGVALPTRPLSARRRCDNAAAMRRAVLVAGVCVVACTKVSAPFESGPPQYVIGVGPGAGMTAITATFTRPQDVKFRDAHCTAVGLDDGAEPPSLEGGRVEVWVAGGQVLGHVDRGAAGAYRTAIRAVLPPGTRLAGSVAGGAGVAAHRFRAPAVVPSPVQTAAPAQGFNARPTQGLDVRWQGGDSSHVSITLSFEPPQGTRGAGLLVSCVVPRAPGRFTVPAAAMSAAIVPHDARSVQLLVAATDRVRDGAYALDVIPLGGEGDQIVGTWSP